jgi:hypothetical protein
MLLNVLSSAARPSASCCISKIIPAFIEFFFVVCNGLPENVGIPDYFRYSAVTEHDRLFG